MNKRFLITMFLCVFTLSLFTLNSYAQTAGELVDRGLELSRKGDREGAIANYSRAIVKQPDLVEAYSRRGMLYRQLGKYDLALADSTKVIGLEPQKAAGYFERACVYDYMKAYDKAVSDYTTAIKLDPNDTSYHLNRSVDYLLLKKYDLALIDVSKVVELEPANYMAYGNRSIIFAVTGRFDEAIADLNKGLEISPNSGWLHGQRGRAYERKYKYDLAMADYEKAIELDPKVASWYRLRGWLQLARKHRAEAYKDAMTALEFHRPSGFDDGLNCVALGYISLMQQGQPAAAKTLLETWIRLSITDAWSKAVLNFLHGDISESQLTALADNDRKLTQAHTYIGEKLRQNGKYDEAYNHFVWVVGNGSKDCDEFVFAHLAFISLGVGDYK